MTRDLDITKFRKHEGERGELQPPANPKGANAVLPSTFVLRYKIKISTISRFWTMERYVSLVKLIKAEQYLTKLHVEFKKVKSGRPFGLATTANNVGKISNCQICLNYSLICAGSVWKENWFILAML